MPMRELLRCGRAARYPRRQGGIAATTRSGRRYAVSRRWRLNVSLSQYHFWTKSVGRMPQWHDNPA